MQYKHFFLIYTSFVSYSSASICVDWATAIFSRCQRSWGQGQSRYEFKCAKHRDPLLLDGLTSFSSNAKRTTITMCPEKVTP